MKKVQIINVLTAILIILFAIICLTGCVSGLPNAETYNTLIDGVSAHSYDGEVVFYDMNILIDNVEFNPQIQSKPYCRLDIQQKQTVEIKGVVFIVRSSSNCTLKFTVNNNLNQIISITKNLQNNVTENIEMFFDNTQTVEENANLYIEIEEILLTEEDEKSNFVFDTLFIFFNEE